MDKQTATIRGGRTAIARKGASAPARWLVEMGSVGRGAETLDYGCGKGADADAFGWDRFDPNHAPDTSPLQRQHAATVCTFVANVLPPAMLPDLVTSMLAATEVGGSCWLTVRRDVVESPEGYTTATGTFQRWVTVEEMALQGFTSVYHRRGAFEIFHRVA